MSSSTKIFLTKPMYRSLMGVLLLVAAIPVAQGLANMMLFSMTWRCTPAWPLGEYRTEAPAIVCTTKDILPNFWLAMALFFVAMITMLALFARYAHWYLEVPRGVVVNHNTYLTRDGGTRFEVVVEGKTRTGTFRRQNRTVHHETYHELKLGDMF